MMSKLHRSRQRRAATSQSKRTKRAGFEREGDFEDELRAVLGRLTWLMPQRYHNGMIRTGRGTHAIRYGIPGAPDIICYLAPHGIAVGLELKARRGAIQETQKQWHAAARTVGLESHFVRTTEEATEILLRAYERFLGLYSPSECAQAFPGALLQVANAIRDVRARAAAKEERRNRKFNLVSRP